jgi:ribulose kinase
MYEQSTSDIWDSICLCVKAILNESGINKKEVKGIGFDATCSLAVVDLEGKSVCVSEGAQLGKEGERDIVLWMDHRAEEEANLINKTEDEVLKYVGGTMSVSPPRIAEVAVLTRHSLL